MRGQLIHLPRRGVSLYVKIIGHGHPLLLMHGGLGVDHSTLLPLAACRDVFKLIFYDHRCNGHSSGADLSSLSWENLVLDAEALRETLGFSQWAVLGHSFGGMIAQEYALRFPKSITHLVLMDTGADAAQVQRNAPKVLTERGFSPSRVEAARRLFNGELRPGELLLVMLKLGKAYYHNHGLPIQGRALIDALRMKSRPDSCIFGFQHLLKGWSIMSRLKEIAVPVLLIAGRSDFQFPPEHQAEMAKAFQRARCEILEQAGHNPLVERPEQTMTLIRQFLEE